MLYLKSVENTKPHVDRISYPYNIPSIHSLDKLTFRSPVTFIVGDNGSGNLLLSNQLRLSQDLMPKVEA
ncbi:hypothetical protein [Sphingobacterium sp. IITKGP-BTPF85]|uniref:hypothetical protein n=1 Tax=Sphingobacterium sp. IITKGP-BTPF85 TaxID=1338009 RepID=UPI000425E1DE|nr:hypothetical protein [Sphingobacterium sp. IITKGP-BTPF85]KKX51354.1 hypothetical protein L950_0205565 [Sphingobacterium sp. IITKGP-BTPF85]